MRTLVSFMKGKLTTSHIKRVVNKFLITTINVHQIWPDLNLEIPGRPIKMIERDLNICSKVCFQEINSQVEREVYQNK